MNSKDVHIGFDDQALREYFAEQLIVANKKISAPKKRTAKYVENDPFAHAIETCEIEIEFITEKKKAYEHLRSVLKLIEERGWSEWDVSDYTSTFEGEWYSFIGTEDERDKVISNLTKRIKV